MFRTAKVLFFVIIASVSFAQKGTHSPYSVFGLGELKMNDYAAFMSMGGVSLASSDSTIINQENPSSLVYIGRHRPIFQTGLDGRLSTFETSSSSTNQRFFGLNQFQLGIPIKKRWGAAFGLKPFSYTGYKISDYTVTDSDSTALRTNEGSGGINKFYLGLGYQPLKKTKVVTIYFNSKDSTGLKYADSNKVVRSNHLSLGANANYVFGSSVKIRTYQYSNHTEGFNSKVQNSLRLSDFIYDFGINYQYSWTRASFEGTYQKTRSIAVGLTYSPGIKVRAFQDLIAYRYQNYGGLFNGSERDIDTVQYVDDNEGSLYIPESYKIGLEYRFGPKNNKNSSLLKIGSDFRYQKWSDYDEDFGSNYSNQLKDRMSFGIGLEWTPVTLVDLRTPLFNKIHYRLGFNYVMTELRLLDNLNNYTDLNAYGMSFGLGVPITTVRNSNTNINFGANLGNMGTTEGGLINEKYIGLFFGVSITPGSGDLWFLKRKYD